MNPASRAHLHIAATTHPGMTGKNNEDRYSVTASHYEEGGGISAVLATVSDGIGGHRAGEVAAEIAIETIQASIAQYGIDNPPAALQAAILQASQAIYEKSESDPGLRGMGATCACGWVIGDRLYIASVGDSRIYLIRGNTIRQVTIDHTWIQEALESGVITAEQARGHPNAHVIRRYLGSRQPVTPDMRLRLQPGQDDEQSLANQGLRLLPGDVIVLCTDGLTDLVGDGEILAVLKDGAKEKALEALTRLANGRGGHDNITIVALQMPPVEVAVAPAPARVPRLSWACAGIAGLIVIGALLFGGAAWLYGWISPAPVSSPTATSTVVATLPVQARTATQRARLTLTSTARPSPSLTPLSPATDTPAAPAQTPIQATLTPWPTNPSP